MALRLYALRNPDPDAGTLALIRRGDWCNSGCGGGGAVNPQLLSTDKADETANGPALRTVGTDGVIGHPFELHVGVYHLPQDIYFDGTVQFCFGSYGGADTTWDHRWYLHIYITLGLTNVIKGTVLSNYQDATSPPLPPQGGTGPEARTMTNVATLSPVQALAGDVLVVEIGYAQFGVSGTPTARALGSGTRHLSGTILPDMQDGDTWDAGNGSGAPWIEFALIPTPPPNPTNCPPCSTAPGTTPNPVGTLPPWVQTCTSGGTVDSVADLADGEDWAA